jgi:S-adenosyl-L-methionine hydrolase (adenosine-forming)
MSRLITLTTDFGVDDPGVAAMKGVIHGVADGVTVVDVTHGVPAFDIRRGALEMTRALPWFPPSVHVGVVDPGVGSERRGVVVRTGRGDLLVGPDNGLFDLVAEQLGGVVEVFELIEPRYRLADTTAVFHWRDVFAPAAAHLVNGVEPSAFGPEIEELVPLSLPEAAVGDGVLETAVLFVDTYGNVKLAGYPNDLAAAMGGEIPGVMTVTIGAGQHRIRWAATFSDVEPGSPMLIDDEDGRLCLACNQANAAEIFSVTPDYPVSIQR